MEEHAGAFLRQVRKNDSQRIEKGITRFVDYYTNAEIIGKNRRAGTLSNYFYAIKPFREMNDLEEEKNWKRLSKGMTHVRRAANDRAPILETIRKLVEFPDRQIKPKFS